MIGTIIGIIFGLIGATIGVVMGLFGAVMGLIGGTLGGVMGIFGSFMGLIFGGIGKLFGLVILFLIGKSIYENKNKKNTSSTVNPRNTSAQNLAEIDRAESAKTSVYSNRKLIPDEQKKAINKELTKYFKSHSEYRLSANVKVAPPKGKFTDIEDLVLYYKDEAIDDISELEPTDFYSIIKSINGNMNSIETEENIKIQSNIAEFIAKIDIYLETVPDAEIKSGLGEMKQLLSRYLAMEKVRQLPNEFEKVTRQYLPLLVNILDKYMALSAANRELEAIKKSESDLTELINVLNTTLRSIESKMVESDYIDIKTDIKVLEKVLEKDGVGGYDPFNKNKVELKL